MKRIKLRVGDNIVAKLDGEIYVKAEVLFVKDGSLMQISLCNVKDQRLNNLNQYPIVIRCTDIYLDSSMEWEFLKHLETVSPRNSFLGIKEASSLSKILYDCKVECGIFEKEKKSYSQYIKEKLWPFKRGTFCSVIHDKSCLRIGWKEIGYDSLEWKELLLKSQTIHFEEPDYEVNLGYIHRSRKGFIYNFTQGIKKAVFIEDTYVNWPIIRHYWDYYGNLDRPDIFHKTIPLWSHNQLHS